MGMAEPRAAGVPCVAPVSHRRMEQLVGGDAVGQGQTHGF